MTSPRAPHFIIISIHSALCTHAEVKSYWRMTVKLLFCRGSQSSDDIINGRSVCKRKEGGVAFLGDAGMLGPPLPSSQMGWPLGSPQTLRFHKGNQCPSPECFCLINQSFTFTNIRNQSGLCPGPRKSLPPHLRFSPGFGEFLLPIATNFFSSLQDFPPAPRACLWRVGSARKFTPQGAANAL